MTPPHTLLGEQIDDSSAQHNHLGCAKPSVHQSHWHHLFHRIQRLPSLQRNIQDGEGEKDGGAKASFISLVFFQCQEWQCLRVPPADTEVCCLLQSGRTNGGLTASIPFQAKATCFTFTAVPNAASQGNDPLCTRFKNPNTRRLHWIDDRNLHRRWGQGTVAKYNGGRLISGWS